MRDIRLVATHAVFGVWVVGCSDTFSGRGQRNLPYSCDSACQWVSGVLIGRSAGTFAKPRGERTAVDPHDGH